MKAENGNFSTKSKEYFFHISGTSWNMTTACKVILKSMEDKCIDVFYIPRYYLKQPYKGRQHSVDLLACTCPAHFLLWTTGQYQR